METNRIEKRYNEICSDNLRLDKENLELKERIEILESEPLEKRIKILESDQKKKYDLIVEKGQVISELEYDIKQLKEEMEEQREGLFNHSNALHKSWQETYIVMTNHFYRKRDENDLLKKEITKLTCDKKHWFAAVINKNQIISDMKKEINKKDRFIETLKKEVARFGRHLNDCCLNPEGDDCTCGFMAYCEPVPLTVFECEICNVKYENITYDTYSDYQAGHQYCTIGNGILGRDDPTEIETEADILCNFECEICDVKYENIDYGSCCDHESDHQYCRSDFERAEGQ